MIELQPIGTIHSCYKAKFGTPRQGNIAKYSNGYIEIDKKWEPQKSLKGLELFSHVWILFWFHDNKNLNYLPTIKPPRLGGKTVGALASRTPIRPNPIGLSLVRIEKIEGQRVYVSGLDIIEGTPVVDIKPYINSYDSVEDSSSGWLEEVEEIPLNVSFTQAALDIMAHHSYPKLKETIEDILSSDIRNRSDKRDIRFGKILGFYFDNLNIVFQVSEEGVLVLEVQIMNDSSKVFKSKEG